MNVAGRKPLFTNPSYAREAVEAIYRVQELYPFHLFGFVIMPEHDHMLLRVPAPGNISSVVRSYKRAVSHAIGIGPIWQPRFHVRMPDDPHAALAYIHQNPVKAGFVSTAEDYPWSSASGKWDVQDLGFIM